MDRLGSPSKPWLWVFSATSCPNVHFFFTFFFADIMGLDLRRMNAQDAGLLRVWISRLEPLTHWAHPMKVSVRPFLHFFATGRILKLDLTLHGTWFAVEMTWTASSWFGWRFFHWPKLVLTSLSGLQDLSRFQGLTSARFSRVSFFQSTVEISPVVLPFPGLSSFLFFWGAVVLF